MKPAAGAARLPATGTRSDETALWEDILCLAVFLDRRQVLLAGTSANLCVQAHMHELLEHGFAVAVIKYATAAAQILMGDGYVAALNNFRFMANAVWTADEAHKRLSE